MVTYNNINFNQKDFHQALLCDLFIKKMYTCLFCIGLKNTLTFPKL